MSEPRRLPLMGIEAVDERPERLEYRLYVRDRSPGGAMGFLFAAMAFGVLALVLWPMMLGALAFVLAATVFWTLPVVRTRSTLTCDATGVRLDGERLDVDRVELEDEDVRFRGNHALDMPLERGADRAVVARMVQGIAQAIAQADAREGAPDPAVQALRGAAPEG